MSEDFNPTRIHHSFDRQSMMATFGAQITALSEGHCEITAPIQDNALQQGGAAHARLTFSIGDSAAGYAALTLMPLDQDVVTTEMKINLLAPAIGDALVATGRVIKAGRRLTVVSAEVHAITEGQRRLVGLLQGTMMPVKMAAPIRR